jgi:hypothetical protein
MVELQLPFDYSKHGDLTVAYSVCIGLKKEYSDNEKAFFEPS